jgi:hypothetical protein
MEVFPRDAVLKHAAESLKSNKGDPTAARDMYFDKLSEWVMELEDAEGGPELYPQQLAAVEALWCGYAAMEKGLRQWKQTVKVFESAITCSVAEKGARVWLEYIQFCVERKKLGNAKKIFGRALNTVRESEADQVWTAFLSFLQTNGTPNITMAELKTLVLGETNQDAGTPAAAVQIDANCGSAMQVAPQPEPGIEVEVGIVKTEAELAAERLSKAQEQGAVIDVALDESPRPSMTQPIAPVEHIVLSDAQAIQDSGGGEDGGELQIQEAAAAVAAPARPRDPRSRKRQKLNSSKDEPNKVVEVEQANKEKANKEKANKAAELNTAQAQEESMQRQLLVEQMRAAAEEERRRRREVLQTRNLGSSRRRISGTLRPPLPDEDERAVVYFSAQHAPQGETLDPSSGMPYVSLRYYRSGEERMMPRQHRQQHQPYPQIANQAPHQAQLLREHTPPSEPLNPRCPPLLFAGREGYSEHEERTAPEIRPELMTALSAALRDGKLFQVVRGLRQIQLAKQEELHARWQQMLRAQLHEGATLDGHHDTLLSTANVQTLGRIREQRMIERARHHEVCLRARAAATKEAESELQQKLMEQQTLLQQAGVPAITVTTDSREIALQRHIIRLIQTTDDMAAKQLSSQQS